MFNFKNWYEKRFFNEIIKKENDYSSYLERIRDHYNAHSINKLLTVKIQLEERILMVSGNDSLSKIISEYIKIFIFIVTPLITMLLTVPGVAVSIFSLNIQRNTLSEQELNDHIHKLIDLFLYLFKLTIDGLGDNIYPPIICFFTFIFLVMCGETHFKLYKVALLKRKLYVVNSLIEEKQKTEKYFSSI